MLWICLWVHPYHNTTSILLTKLLGFPGESRVLLGNKPQCYVMDNALDSFLMASISMMNTLMYLTTIYDLDVPMNVPLEASLPC